LGCEPQHLPESDGVDRTLKIADKVVLRLAEDETGNVARRPVNDRSLLGSDSTGGYGATSIRARSFYA
jgi:hypothetical protein